MQENALKCIDLNACEYARGSILVFKNQTLLGNRNVKAFILKNYKSVQLQKAKCTHEYSLLLRFEAQQIGSF